MEANLITAVVKVPYRYAVQECDATNDEQNYQCPEQKNHKPQTTNQKPF